MSKLPIAQIDAPEINLEMLAVLAAGELVKLANDPSVVIEIEDYALDAQKAAAHRSQMLKQPLRALMEANKDDAPIPAGLAELKTEMEKLDPKQLDLKPGFASRIAGYVPFVATPLQRYFQQFESAESNIDAIIDSLNKSKDQMIRDNKTMADDRVITQETVEMVKRRIIFGKALDAELLKKVATADAETEKFIQEQLRFKLNKRLMALSQQLAVSLNSILAVDAVVGNNKELVDGVNLASTLSVSALTTAVTVAIALANQKIALRKIQALHAVTGNMIEDTSIRLKTQGVAIQTQASEAMLPMDQLKRSFKNTFEALDNLSTYRREGLPKMAAVLLEMDAMTGDAEARLKQIVGGQKADAALIAAPTNTSAA